MVIKKDKKSEIIPGVYKHFKNNKEYQVLSYGTDSESMDDVVIYQALYGDHKVWVRPMKMFLETVKHEGKKVPRFKLVSEANAEDTFDNKYKRALADYQNLLKRTAEEKKDYVKYANEQMILDMIPVYNNLKLSLKHIDEQAEGNGWAEGIKYVVKQFKEVLKNAGVEEIETAGKKFDHNTMEAVEGKGDKVVKEARAGYILNGKVIVPAKVVLK